MIYFVTDQSPASDEVIDAAKAVGAVILHGVPPALAGDIPDGTIGLFEVPEPISLPIPDPEPPADPLAAVMELLAQVAPDQLARVLALGVAVTEPESVDRLTTAVETGDLTDGMAVVAEAASTAHAITEVQP